MSPTPSSRPPLPALPVEELHHHPEALNVAVRWQDRFHLVCAEAPPEPGDGMLLWAGVDGLRLLRRDGRRLESLRLTATDVQRRARQGDELLRACGLTGGPTGREAPTVLDAMAGWGIDALVLAARGCAVTLVERHPVVSAMQEDLVVRCGATDARCLWGDGYEVMAAMPGCDVVYLDPMFPERRKGALPGKRMQWLTHLAAADTRPLDQWLEAARALARSRVVLKRRRTDPPVAPPDWQIVGRSVRYDVFRAG